MTAETDMVLLSVTLGSIKVVLVEFYGWIQKSHEGLRSGFLSYQVDHSFHKGKQDLRQRDVPPCQDCWCSLIYGQYNWFEKFCFAILWKKGL